MHVRRCALAHHHVLGDLAAHDAHRRALVLVSRQPSRCRRIGREQRSLACRPVRRSASREGGSTVCRGLRCGGGSARPRCTRECRSSSRGRRRHCPQYCGRRRDARARSFAQLATAAVRAPRQPTRAWLNRVRRVQQPEHVVQWVQQVLWVRQVQWLVAPKHRWVTAVRRRMRWARRDRNARKYHRPLGEMRRVQRVRKVQQVRWA